MKEISNVIQGEARGGERLQLGLLAEYESNQIWAFQGELVECRVGGIWLGLFVSLLGRWMG